MQCDNGGYWPIPKDRRYADEEILRDLAKRQKYPMLDFCEYKFPKSDDDEARGMLAVPLLANPIDHS